MVLSLILFIIPLVYFDCRAGQPMSIPEYSDRSYYELLVERKIAYDTLAREYQTSHPNKRVQFDMCFFTEVSFLTFDAMPNAGFYALVWVFPELKSYANHQDLIEGYVPETVNWLGFLSAWWQTFEKFVYGTADHAQHGPVPYCRISPY
jgi:hypothetical protein